MITGHWSNHFLLYVFLPMTCIAVPVFHIVARLSGFPAHPSFCSGFWPGIVQEWQISEKMVRYDTVKSAVVAGSPDVGSWHLNREYPEKWKAFRWYKVQSTLWIQFCGGLHFELYCYHPIKTVNLLFVRQWWMHRLHIESVMLVFVWVCVALVFVKESTKIGVPSDAMSLSDSSKLMNSIQYINWNGISTWMGILLLQGGFATDCAHWDQEPLV